MITNFKIFENIDEPQVGDYVYAMVDRLAYKKSHIGQIVKIVPIDEDSGLPFLYPYIVRVGDKDFDTMHLKRSEIVEFSKNKKELKFKIKVNKYNL